MVNRIQGLLGDREVARLGLVAQVAEVGGPSLVAVRCSSILVASLVILA